MAFGRLVSLHSRRSVFVYAYYTGVGICTKIIIIIIIMKKRRLFSLRFFAIDIPLLLFQAWILKRCPGEMVMVFFYSFFVSVLSAMVCLFTERDLGAWSLKSKTRLWSVLYSVINLKFQFSRCLTFFGFVF